VQNSSCSLLSVGSRLRTNVFMLDSITHARPFSYTPSDVSSWSWAKFLALPKLNGSQNICAVHQESIIEWGCMNLPAVCDMYRYRLASWIVFAFRIEFFYSYFVHEHFSFSRRLHVYIGISSTSATNNVICKDVLCFNCAPHHEGVLGKWLYSSTHSLTSTLNGGE
jgi:hypothetical protein